MQTVRYGEEQVWEGRRTTVGPTMAGEVQGKFFFNTSFWIDFFVLFSSHAFVGDGYMLVVALDRAAFRIYTEVSTPST